MRRDHGPSPPLFPTFSRVSRGNSRRNPLTPSLSRNAAISAGELIIFVSPPLPVDLVSHFFRLEAVSPFFKTPEAEPAFPFEALPELEPALLFKTPEPELAILFKAPPEAEPAFPLELSPALDTSRCSDSLDGFCFLGELLIKGFRF